MPLFTKQFISKYLTMWKGVIFLIYHYVWVEFQQETISNDIYQFFSLSLTSSKYIKLWIAKKDQQKKKKEISVLSFQTAMSFCQSSSNQANITSGSMGGYLRPLLFPRHLVFPPSSSWHQKPFWGSNLKYIRHIIIENHIQ